MKYLLSLLCVLFTFCAPSAHSAENVSPWAKGCLVKSSRFDRWVGKSSRKLTENSYIVQTSLGPIQYAWHGKGPVLLSIHGGFGGYDQGLVIADSFVKEHYSVLAVSRPGYLDTPLISLAPSIEFTPAQQADLIAALLDALNIPNVVALGFSAGGPVAFELAKRHSDKVTALVLESIGAQPNDSLISVILTPLLSQPTLLDFTAFTVYQSSQADIYSTAKFMLSQDTTLTGTPLGTRVRYVATHGYQYRLLKKFLASTLPVTSRLAGILNDLLGANYWGNPVFDPAGFTVPTIIVQSVDDSNGYYSNALNVSARIPGSSFIPVQETGHFLWFGPNTSDWQHEVVDFLLEHRPEGSFKPDCA